MLLAEPPKRTGTPNGVDLAMVRDRGFGRGSVKVEGVGGVPLVPAGLRLLLFGELLLVPEVRRTGGARARSRIAAKVGGETVVYISVEDHVVGWWRFYGVRGGKTTTYKYSCHSWKVTRPSRFMSKSSKVGYSSGGM